MLLQAPPRRKSLGVTRCPTCEERSARRLSSSNASRATSASRSSVRRASASRDSRARTPPPSLLTSVTDSDTDTDTDTDETADVALGRVNEEQRQPEPAESCWRTIATVLVHDLPAFMSALVVVMTCGGVNPSRLTL